METWDKTVDILVIGSGGGGMTAALVAKNAGMNVLMVEKSKYYGGSTALSGGSIWVPNNHFLVEAGIEDSFEKARIYLDNTVGNSVTSLRKDAYVKYSPEMITWLEEHSKLKFISIPWYSDYHPDLPGGLAEGRALEVKPFNGKELNKDLKYLNPSIFKAHFN